MRAPGRPDKPCTVSVVRWSAGHRLAVHQRPLCPARLSAAKRERSVIPLRRARESECGTAETQLVSRPDGKPFEQGPTLLPVGHVDYAGPGQRDASTISTRFRPARSSTPPRRPSRACHPLAGNQPHCRPPVRAAVLGVQQRRHRAAQARDRHLRRSRRLRAKGYGCSYRGRRDRGRCPRLGASSIKAVRHECEPDAAIDDKAHLRAAFP